MTELEIMQRAKMYMDKLAQGIDPITDQEMENDTVLNNVRLARCFFYVSNVLGQVIANGGVVVSSSSQSFTITEDQLLRVQISPQPIIVSQLAAHITEAAGDLQKKKLAPTVITNWLVQKGYLEKQSSPDGKDRRVPTESGLRIGLSAKMRQGPHGEYMSVYYDENAQRFVLDHFLSMLAGA